MPDRPHDIAMVVDMLVYARDVVAYARSVTRVQLTRRSPHSAVLERWIEVIGEAARGVSHEFRKAHPEIPRTPIVRTRHILAHDYGRVNHDIPWRIITDYLPDLIRHLEPLVPPEPVDTLDPEP